MVSYILGLSFALEFDPIGSLVWKLSPVPCTLEVTALPLH